MSDHIPCFSVIVTAAEVPASLESCWDGSDLVAAKGGTPQCWSSTSRNNWHQHLLARCLETLPELSPVGYLTRDIAYLDPAAVQHMIPLVQRFLGRCFETPSLASRNLYWAAYGFPEEAAVRTGLGAAVVEHELDDRDFDQEPGFDSFFSFIQSSLAALEQAAGQGDAVLYVQFHG